MDLKALQVTLRGFAAELVRLADETAIVIEEAPGARTHVLIDWENVQPNEDDVRKLVPEATDLWLFHGPNQKNVTSRHSSFGGRATPIRIAKTGKNALDFHLSFYMGYIASRQPEARFVALSNDKGYGPMLEHAKELGFAVQQMGFGAAKVLAMTPARKVATKKAAAAPAAGKKAAVKKAAKKAPAKLPAKKVPAKTAATKKASSKPPAVKTRGSVPLSAADRPTPTRKSLEEVLAILKRSPAASRPRKLARLLAYIASMIGVDAESAEPATMLNQVIASGAVSINKESVTYAF